MKDVEMKQYENLRNNIKTVSDHILGEDYYNMGCDVYSADKEMCKDIIRKYDRLKKLNNSLYIGMILLLSVIVILIVGLIYKIY